MGNVRANFLRVIAPKGSHGEVISENFVCLFYNDLRVQTPQTPQTPMVFFTSAYHPMYMNARQLGRGGITVFHRSPVPHVQHGGGLRSSFKSVACVVTLLAAKAVRYACETGLETGNGILSDVLSGENVKAATKRRASAALQQAKQDALTEVKRRRGASTTTTTTTTGEKRRRKGGQKD